MKKFMSILMVAMMVSATCVYVSADDEPEQETNEKATIKVVDKSDNDVKTYETNVGDKIEVTVKGYSQEAISGFLTSTYFNQTGLEEFVEYSDINVFAYDTTAYATDDNGTTFYKSDINGMSVRPEDETEIDRDVFGCCYTSASSTGSYNDEGGQIIVKFALEVKEAGESVIATVVDDAAYEVNGEDVSDATKLTTDTTILVNGEEPVQPEVPTEEPTKEPTTPTEVPTQIPTDTSTAVPTAPTSATNTTVAPTSATNATNSTTATTATSGNAVNNTSSNNNNSSTSGKVSTGDNTTMIIALFALALASGVTVVAKKKSKN